VARSGPTLFARLGGMDGIRALVDEIASRVAADDRIQRFFVDTDFRRFKAQLVVQLCQLSGGPCRYRGHTMAVAHRGRGIAREHVDAFLADVAAAFDGTRVSARARGELIDILARLRVQVIDGARP
jgi:hemoglobin